MTDDNNSATDASLRSRQQTKAKANMGATNGEPSSSSSYSPSSPTSSSSSSSPSAKAKRNSPYLPTPVETAVLLAYPAILVFGALFSAVSPQTRNAAYDPIRQSHAAGEAPSYFARKDNVFNALFVKQGWAWITAAFAAFAATHPVFGGRLAGESSEAGTIRRLKAALRWALVTAWWVLVTQWCFGPPIIDRGFRFTGGKCDSALEAAAEASEGGTGADASQLLTAVACKAAGGRWSGGHDISGHVFLLVLGSCFLVQEVGWVVYRAGRAGAADERCVVMPDGAVKGAGVEAERGSAAEERALGYGGRFAAAVVGLCLWMLLMTAIYFHTWFEKFTGLLVAAMGIYPVYILPRWMPALRAFVGLPGI